MVQVCDIESKIDIVRPSYFYCGDQLTEVNLTRLSSKGQVVIPKGLRETLGLDEGAVFAMYGKDDTIILKRLDIPSDSDFERILEWGEKVAREKGITRKDVIQAINEERSGG